MYRLPFPCPAFALTHATPSDRPTQCPSCGPLPYPSEHTQGSVVGVNGCLLSLNQARNWRCVLHCIYAYTYGRWIRSRRERLPPPPPFFIHTLVQDSKLFDPKDLTLTPLTTDVVDAVWGADQPPAPGNSTTYVTYVVFTCMQAGRHAGWQAD